MGDPGCEILFPSASSYVIARTPVPINPWSSSKKYPQPTGLPKFAIGFQVLIWARHREGTASSTSIQKNGHRPAHRSCRDTTWLTPALQNIATTVGTRARFAPFETNVSVVNQ